VNKPTVLTSRLPLFDSHQRKTSPLLRETFLCCHLGITQGRIFSEASTQDVSLFHAALFQQHSNGRHTTLLLLVFKTFDADQSGPKPAIAQKIVNSLEVADGTMDFSYRPHLCRVVDLVVQPGRQTYCRRSAAKAARRMRRSDVEAPLPRANTDH
jgi:hypothetical protein